VHGCVSLGLVVQAFDLFMALSPRSPFLVERRPPLQTVATEIAGPGFSGFVFLFDCQLPTRPDPSHFTVGSFPKNSRAVACHNFF